MGSQFGGNSVCDLKYSIAAVNYSAVRSLHQGVISATDLGIKYSSSLCDKSYGS